MPCRKRGLMPDPLITLPPDLQHLPRVQMVPPPSSILKDVTALVEDAARELAPGEQGRLAWVATTTGINLALVAKVKENDHVKVTVSGWVAKEWCEPIAAGIGGTVSWR
jgi:hypothetical protein